MSRAPIFGEDRRLRDREERRGILNASAVNDNGAVVQRRKRVKNADQQVFTDLRIQAGLPVDKLVKVVPSLKNDQPPDSFLSEFIGSLDNVIQVARRQSLSF